MISDGEYVYNTFNNDGYDIASELFQICYDSKSYEYKMIQSNDAVFIVSGNVINKIPLYSELVSSNYGCGYCTDTTPNKWFGAAPYYFASNVLNSGKNNTQKDIYLLYFKQNFKVELEKLLRNIPDAFVEYTQSRLVDKLKQKGFSIDGDDGQILDLIINSVAATTSNSIGMYVQEKFAEKIGDDETYEQFATDVYNACRFDSTNNMTEDFYKIFEELYDAAIVDAINNMNLLKNGLANWLLRYYQNHKGEWAESMTSLIDIDTVDPEWYEIPLKASSVNIPKNTYKFTYDNNGGTYNFDYVSSPSAHYKEENIIEGYYYNGKFYSDVEHQELINDVTRDPETGNYYDADGDLICYYDSKNDRYCRYETEDYVLSEDTEIDLSKTYYEKTGTGIYTYTPTTDTEEDENKQYYSKSYGLTDDSFVIEDKVYLSKTAEEYKYERMPSNLPTYELGSYFEKLDYSLTEDTSISANKNYYVNAFTEATGEISSSTQYYKINYVPTTDLQIDPDKEYFEVIDLSSYVIGTAGTYFEYDPEAAEKYKVVFEQANTPFDSDQDYYTEVEANVYELVLDANEQGGPYYIISEFTRDDNNGTYVKKTFTNDTAKVYYSRVVNPTLNNLAAYYEATYVKIPTPTSLTDVYVLEYILVDEPNVSDISTYYEETDDTYVPAENISYNYDPETGNPVSINNDRNYYLRTYIPGVYYIIENPTGNPSQKGWYEYEYNAVMSGTFANPSAKGYYERSSSPIGFDVVPTIYIRTGEGTEQDPYVYTNINIYSPPQQSVYYVRSGSGTPEDPYVYTEETEWRAQDTHYVRSGSGTEQDPYVYHEVEELYFVHSGSGTEEDPYVWVPINEVSPVEKGWYELKTSYSTLYDDKKLYIDLEPETVQSRFPDEDEDWHDMFYDSVLAAKVVVEQAPEEEAKAKALEELNKIQTKLMPSWLWQYLITESVSKYYVPKQGDQYRQIILDSNMYPIQWDELPDDIDHNSFDYALTALLYAIKQRLITNVTLLVDGGKVKCYSCVDAATVIQKMVNRNSVIWSNQIRTAKTKVTKANTKAEVLKAFDMIQMPEDSLLMLEEILNKQSGLYAKYIDMIIEEQVINDNTTEVSL